MATPAARPSPGVVLNIDLGERADEDETLYALAHVANIACGGHAGDLQTMTDALERCRRHGARPAAHPSYPDREGFGRRAWRGSVTALAEAVAWQCDALAQLARRDGRWVRVVKPHGALYHEVARDRAQAEATVDGALRGLGLSPSVDVVLVGAEASALRDVARDRGLGYWVEGFCDRATNADGTLVPRGAPGAVLTDPAAAAARARAFVREGRVQTACVHGDTPGAVAIARAVRLALDTP